MTARDGSDRAGSDGSATDSSTEDDMVTSAADDTPDASDTPDAPDTPARRATGSAVRRPNPAASAASRARRIGGAAAAPRSTVHGADPATPSTGVGGPAGGSATGPADTSAEPDAGSRSGPSLRKRARRTATADEPAAKDRTDAAAVTEVPGWLRWAPATVLTACAVAIIVIIAVAAHGVWYAKPSTSAERDQVLAAAKKCMAAVNTYNYTTLTADEKTGLACTTGDWTAQYKSALTKIVIPTATQLKASQTVRINAAGIESVADHGRQWTTIVYGQVTLNQSGATPRIDPFSAVVRMDKVSPTYKISKIDLITTPNT